MAVRGSARDGPCLGRVRGVEADLSGPVASVLLGVDPAHVRLPGGLLAGAEGGPDLRPRGTRLAGGADGELTPVGRLAGDHLAQGEQFEELGAVQGLVVAAEPGEGLAGAQFVEAGHGGQQGVLRLDALGCRRAQRRVGLLDVKQT
ncbi:hypothetical protein SVIOM342S_07703 [Streptomyces violaceorubidus]